MNHVDSSDSALSRFDHYLDNSSDIVALRLSQNLAPVDPSGIIYPPTYADIGYNIDTLADGRKVALIDSVGSQANRMEPIFKSDSSDISDWLVPQVRIVIRKNPRVVVSLLDLAHRAADAVVQSTPGLAELVNEALRSLQQGDAYLLCTIAPTSLVFGVWDSRGGTGEKRPRIVRSLIRAWDIEVLHSAAQFNSIWKSLTDDEQNELRKAAGSQDQLSKIGLADAPAVFRPKTKREKDGLPNPEARVLGGVLVKGEVRRDVTVNLLALRQLRGKDAQKTLEIRRYLLGLSLLAATHEMDLFLREGCLLRYQDESDEWFEIPRRGAPREASLAAFPEIEEYANAVADPFRKKWLLAFSGQKNDQAPSQAGATPNFEYEFDLKEAKKLAKKKTAEDAE